MNRSSIKNIYLKLKQIPVRDVVEKIGVPATAIASQVAFFAYLHEHPESVKEFKRIIKILLKIHDSIYGEGIGLSQAEMTNSVKSLLQQHGNVNIKTLYAWRTPILSRKLIDIITGGTFEKNIKSLDYRDVFHVGVAGLLDDGTKFNLEKIDSVVNSPFPNLEKSDYIELNPRLTNTTLQSVFDNLQNRLGVDLWRYNARTANCQDFVIQFLSAGITNALTPRVKSFIKQDALTLTQGAPNKFMTLVTDIERKIKQGITK